MKSKPKPKTTRKPKSKSTSKAREDRARRLSAAKAAADRADSLQVELRVEITKELLIQANSKRAVVAQICQEFGIGESQAYEYVSRAAAEIASTVDLDPGKWLHEALEIRRSIRRRAIAAGELKIELDAAKDEAELLGLYAPKNINFTAPSITDRLKDFTDEEIWARIKEYETKLGFSAGTLPRETLEGASGQNQS